MADVDSSRDRIKPANRLRDAARKWLSRREDSDLSQVWLQGGGAIIIGLLAGAGVWVFKALILLITGIMFGKVASFLAPLGHWSIALIPILGGLLVGLVMHFFIGHERHHGVAGIMEAVAVAGGRLRYTRMPYKAVAAALSIGSGASVGPEDPSVQIGANIGSFFGQKLRLSDERMRTLVAAGATAGISAAFNAPIAGVFFALEIILGEISGSAFGMVILASVVSTVFYQFISGNQPAFTIPAYQFNSPLELPLYLLLGLLAGLVASAYIWLLYKLQDGFGQIKLPTWSKPALAGLVVGVVGIWLPQVFGVGYETIDKILNGEDLIFGLLVALLFAKLLVTAVSIAGGFPGGLFAPSLFLGATLGGAFGLLAQRLLPGLQIQPEAFALVGMSAVLAGAVHAPLTAIILLFEMTRDYRIILPLMLAALVSLLLSKAIMKDSVYTLGLARKGIRLNQGRDVDVLEAIQVEELMQTELESFPEDLPLSEAMALLEATHHHGLPVFNRRDELVGMLTIADIEQAKVDGRQNKTVGDICSRDLVVTYPDDSISVALRKMSGRDLGRLPVVMRNNPQQIVGMLHRSDMVRAYDLALVRREALRHRVHQVRLDQISPDSVGVSEMVIQPGSPVVGKKMMEVKWPKDSLVATLRRGRRVIIPHGETVLQPGDVLAVVVNDSSKQPFIDLCTPDGDGSKIAAS